MEIQKIYLETTIFNLYFEPHKFEHIFCITLFDDIVDEKFKAYTSSFAYSELIKTKEIKKRTKMLDIFYALDISILNSSDKIFELANKYHDSHAIPIGSATDAQQIAAASANNIGIIISTNFKHISRDTTRFFANKVNAENNCCEIQIFSPSQFLKVKGINIA